MTVRSLDEVMAMFGVTRDEVDAACTRCGQPAEGNAFINDERYCHGNADPTCYMLESWERSKSTRFRA